MGIEHEFPILEYDQTLRALIEPTHIHASIDIPECCVLCFFQDALAEVCAKNPIRTVKNLRSELGMNPVYELSLHGKRVAFVHPGVGAPLAAGFLEELIALGCTKFIACGGAGVLDSTIAVGHVIIPTSAVRDEGTSYHYLPPSREVSASIAGVAALEQVLRQHQVPYILGKTWTTDALYRETLVKRTRRRDEGCITVEMEAAAFFAVAQFRGVEFAEILYGGDDVGSDQWDSREWTTHSSVREKLFWLAAETCCLM